MEYDVKFKRADTGKFWSAGKLTEGKFGPQIGMKVTPELRAFLDSNGVGEWINFNLYEPRDKAKPAENKYGAGDIDDEIGF